MAGNKTLPEIVSMFGQAISSVVHLIITRLLLPAIKWFQFFSSSAKWVFQMIMIKHVKKNSYHNQDAFLISQNGCLCYQHNFILNIFLVGVKMKNLFKMSLCWQSNVSRVNSLSFLIIKNIIFFTKYFFRTNYFLLVELQQYCMQ